MDIMSTVIKIIDAIFLAFIYGTFMIVMSALTADGMRTIWNNVFADLTGHGEISFKQALAIMSVIALLVGQVIVISWAMNDIIAQITLKYPFAL